MVLGSERELRKIHRGSQILDLFQSGCGMWVTGTYNPAGSLGDFNFLLCKNMNNTSYVHVPLRNFVSASLMKAGECHVPNPNFQRTNMCQASS